MRDLSLATKLLYAAGSIGTGAFYAFNNFVSAAHSEVVWRTDLLIGLLSSTRSIEGAVIQPTIGALSDRIWTPFGRRRPFMLIGIPLSALFFVAAPSSTAWLRWPSSFSCFRSSSTSPSIRTRRLLADIVPLEQRGWLSGLARLCSW